MYFWNHVTNVHHFSFQGEITTNCEYSTYITLFSSNCIKDKLSLIITPVSYTHLTLPTNREV